MGRGAVLGEWEGVDLEREKMQAVPTQAADVLGLLGPQACPIGGQLWEDQVYEISLLPHPS